MTNETVQMTSTSSNDKRIPFGTRLKSTREAMGLERKDVATQLRLNEKIIVMMEKDRYPVDLPVTFIRGYLRSYAKFLQIPELEIKRGIEPIKPKTVQNDPVAPIKQPDTITSGDYFMQFFTYLIIFTLVALVAMWWYTHPARHPAPAAENQSAAVAAAPENSNLNVTPSESENATANETQDKLSVDNDQLPSTDEEMSSANATDQAKPDTKETAQENIVQKSPAEIKSLDKKPAQQAAPANASNTGTTAAKSKTKPAQTASSATTTVAPGKPKPAQTPVASATAAKPAATAPTTASGAVGQIIADADDSADETAQIDETSGEPMKHTPQRQKHN